MAYDEDLADRIRELTQNQDALTEKRMFGGLAFLVNGNMAVAASGQGGLMLRVDPALSEEYVDDVHVTRMEMRGRELDGWLRVADEGLSDAALARWVDVGTSYARSLPAKPR
ncbi:TfoX family protein [Nocardioides marmoriginsengisoli]|uniref:TfoX family protein n=1 Tax=Nocardioides marmoriginsengisoli TaxID=661483 RepID=A0A3N0CD42_9ACTN|nr:TfoX/Sxy family protein [Nocardioides marmoriginsengisoli]RNL61367.1 TfoX family protein [Nocardioides marmoriginsengisoli]